MAVRYVSERRRSPLTRPERYRVWIGRLVAWLDLRRSQLSVEVMLGDPAPLIACELVYLTLAIRVRE